MACSHAPAARPARAPPRTRSPRSMYLTATSSLVALLRISLATPKLPEPMSRICKHGRVRCGWVRWRARVRARVRCGDLEKWCQPPRCPVAPVLRSTGQLLQPACCWVVLASAVHSLNCCRGWRVQQHRLNFTQTHNRTTAGQTEVRRYTRACCVHRPEQQLWEALTNSYFSAMLLVRWVGPQRLRCCRGVRCSGRAVCVSFADASLGGAWSARSAGRRAAQHGARAG
jgi:hypothetical protein